MFLMGCAQISKDGPVINSAPAGLTQHPPAPQVPAPTASDKALAQYISDNHFQLKECHSQLDSIAIISAITTINHVSTDIP